MYSARIAGHGSILANAALLIENTLSDRHMTTHADNMAWMPIVGESIFRFDETDAARQQASPSLSFENPTLRNMRVDASSFEKKSPAFLPTFEVDGGQQEVVFTVRKLPSFIESEIELLIQLQLFPLPYLLDMGILLLIFVAKDEHLCYCFRIDSRQSH